MFSAESQTTLFAAALTHSFVNLFIYADPGSGTLVWQLLLAAFFGGLFYFRRLKDLVVDRWRQKKS